MMIHAIIIHTMMRRVDYLLVMSIVILGLIIDVISTMAQRGKEINIMGAGMISSMTLDITPIIDKVIITVAGIKMYIMINKEDMSMIDIHAITMMTTIKEEIHIIVHRDGRSNVVIIEMTDGGGIIIVMNRDIMKVNGHQEMLTVTGGMAGMKMRGWLGQWRQITSQSPHSLLVLVIA